MDRCVPNNCLWERTDTTINAFTVTWIRPTCAYSHCSERANTARLKSDWSATADEWHLHMETFKQTMQII